jgi:nitric oxide reductase subunit B
MQEQKSLSPWWRHSVVLVLIFGFTVLIWLTTRAYRDGPPIPGSVVDPDNRIVFTGDEILAGQQVFLKRGLMENGSIWGHGAYLGPDFSAQYLHNLVLHANEIEAANRFDRPAEALSAAERAEVAAAVRRLLKENRYDPASGALLFTEAEVASFHEQIPHWRDHFATAERSAGLPGDFVHDPIELRQLTAFFAWTAWASVANRPGQSYSYTNNFPYDPAAGNTVTGEAVLWSALSLIALLAGTALVLFAFGRFNYLGWKGQGDHIHPRLIPGVATPSQIATIKYFAIVVLLFLVQALVGGGVAHYRAEPGGFYGFDLTQLFPSQILRTWHLQLAIFWIATAYVAGGLFLAPAVGEREPEGQVKGVNLLFGALVLVVAGSLLGEWLGVNDRLGDLWFWIGHQGWEYLDLGRAWQILLVAGLILWTVLVFRGVAPARQDPQRREIASLFLYASVAIPLFYLPAMFFSSTSHFTVVDTWRFWIIHLWVEGFLELFVTAMVAVMFYKLGMITHVTAARVVYLDALLYLGSGIIGTGHHWYFTGQSHITMALAAVFSALEVVPLTLLTLDAWDFVRLTRARCDVCNKAIAIPHKWTFSFLLAVGFWNFVGAGIFGFLINLPVVSYFEVGTILTPNHGHAAMMGVFGMLAVALIAFSFRQIAAADIWPRVERCLRVSFWGLNLGLGLMVASNLFPAGVLQLRDVLENGYWHARGPEFLQSPVVRMIEWLRLPGDAVFILAGILPLVLASAVVYGSLRKGSLPTHTE